MVLMIDPPGNRAKGSMQGRTRRSVERAGDDGWAPRRRVALQPAAGVGRTSVEGVARIPIRQRYGPACNGADDAGRDRQQDLVGGFQRESKDRRGAGDTIRQRRTSDFMQTSSDLSSEL